MKTVRLLAVGLLVALSACTWRPDPDKHAREFFDEGRDTIMSTLKKQDATDAQLQAAKTVLLQNKSSLPPEIADVLRKQQTLLRAIVTGQDSATLTKLEADLHQSNEKAVRAIGQMHEELAAAVGDKTWKATTAALEKRWSKHVAE
jgi:hypothetical protein